MAIRSIAPSKIPKTTLKTKQTYRLGSDLLSNFRMVDARHRTSQAIVYFLVAVALVGSHLSKVGGGGHFASFMALAAD